MRQLEWLMSVSFSVLGLMSVTVVEREGGGAETVCGRGVGALLYPGPSEQGKLLNSRGPRHGTLIHPVKKQILRPPGGTP